MGDGQGGLACCGSWDHKESDMTEQTATTWPQMPRQAVGAVRTWLTGAVRKGVGQGSDDSLIKVTLTPPSRFSSVRGGQVLKLTRQGCTRCKWGDSRPGGKVGRSRRLC